MVRIFSATCIIVNFMCLFIYSSVNRQKTVDTDSSEGESKNVKLVVPFRNCEHCSLFGYCHIDYYVA